MPPKDVGPAGTKNTTPMGNIDVSVPARYQADYADDHNTVVPSQSLNGGVSRVLVRRGHMEMSRAIGRSPDQPEDRVRYGLRFMMNPSTLNFSYQFDQSDSFDAPNDPDANFGAGYFPSQQSFNVTLLFDRTVEVYQGDRSVASTHEELGSGAKVGLIGVQEDIWQFQKMIGNHNESFFTSVTNSARPIMLFPATTIARSNQIPAREDALSGNGWKPILGWISGADITYTQFSNRMIPMRAVLNMSFTTFLTSPNTVGTTGGQGTGQGLQTVTDVVENITGVPIPQPGAAAPPPSTSPPNVGDGLFGPFFPGVQQ